MNKYTKLIVRDLHAEMNIGIFEKDKTALCPLLINLEAYIHLPQNWQADNYEQILGYDKLVDMIRVLTHGRHMNLVETLAETIAQKCFEWPQIDAVKVRIEKTHMFDDCIPGVEIYRER